MTTNTDPFRPIRFQGDGKQQQYSDEAGLSFEGTEVLTRQEFAEESNINNILTKHGINPLTMKEMTWGQEIDERIDLQTALYAIEQARTIMPHVPQELRAKYDNWQKVLNAVESGEYAYDLDQLDQKKKRTKEVEERQALDQRELAERRQRDRQGLATERLETQDSPVT